MRLTDSFIHRPHADLRGRGPARGGMTLVELLVVIVLITTLVATAIPIVSPGGEDRRLREASRNINTYLQGAQARAVETGRPFGVALHRQSADTERGADSAKCVRLEYVEVPPAYSGFDNGSTCRIGVLQQGNLRQIGLQLLTYNDGDPPTRFVPSGYTHDLVPEQFIRPGDTIEIFGTIYNFLEPAVIQDNFAFRWPGSDIASSFIDGQPSTGFFRGPSQGEGLVFLITPVSGEQPDLPLAHDAEGNPLPSPETLANLDFDDPIASGPHWTTPAPYRIFRQPVPAAGEPYELPAGVAIDLQASVVGGVDINQLYDASVDYDVNSQSFPNETPRTDPVLLLFSPEGAVSRLQGQVVSDGTNDRNPRELPPQTVTGTVALCVGRNELIPAAPFGQAAEGTLSKQSFANPIDLDDPALTNLSEAERAEETNNYNWLNLESRWVIVGGQTGTVETIEGVTPEGLAAPDLTTAQIGAVLENVANRRRAGGN